MIVQASLAFWRLINAEPERQEFPLDKIEVGQKTSDGGIGRFIRSVLGKIGATVEQHRKRLAGQVLLYPRMLLAVNGFQKEPEAALKLVKVARENEPAVMPLLVAHLYSDLSLETEITEINHAWMDGYIISLFKSCPPQVRMLIDFRLEDDIEVRGIVHEIFAKPSSR